MYLRVLAFLIGCALSNAAAATLLTFDDWPAGANPVGYGPIIWSEDALAMSSIDDPRLAPGIVSGQQGLQSSGDAWINLYFAGPVDLVSLYVTALPYDPATDPTRIIDFSGLTANGTWLTGSFDHNGLAPTYVRLDWDQLVFLHIGEDSVYPSYAEFVIDDVYLVPEPSTWAMMLLGFATIGVALRRGRRSRPNLRYRATLKA